MKLIISQRVLEAAVKKAALFAPAKSTLPALETLRFSANGKLEICATDLETAVRVTVSESAGYRGITDGVAMLPADLLQRCLTSTLEREGEYGTKKLHDVDGEITAVHDPVTHLFRLEIGGKLIASMNTPKEDGLPQITFEEAAPGFYLEAEMLTEIARKCLPFVATDGLRPAMMGVLLQYDGAKLTATATNGHALVSLDIPAIAPAPFVAIIQANTLAKAAQVLAGPVYIAFNPTHVQLVAEAIEITARLIDDSYPNWKAVVPVTDKVRAITVDREELRAALPSLAPCMNRHTHRIGLAIEKDCERTRFVVTAGSDEGNEAQIWQRAEDSAPGNGYLSVHLSAHYLNAALAALGGSSVTFEFSEQPTDESGKYPPIVIRESNEQNDGHGNILLIIMPHRLPAPDVTQGMQGTALAAEVAPMTSENVVTIEEEPATAEPYDATREQLAAFAGVEKVFAAQWKVARMRNGDEVPQ